MDASIIVSVVSAGSAVVASAVAWLAFKTSRSDHFDDERDKKTKAAVASAMESVTTKMAESSSAVSSMRDAVARNTSEIEKVGTRMGSLMDRTAVLETKIEVFWRNVAIDAAKIIHSPDPARAHIDALLERFMAGTITAAQKVELRKILIYLRDYHPGDPSDFPIHSGEQTAAAILLRTMEYVT